MKDTKEFTTLAHGAGGKEMNALIKRFNFPKPVDWQGSDDDAAHVDLLDGNSLFFTTDSF